MPWYIKRNGIMKLSYCCLLSIFICDFTTAASCWYDQSKISSCSPTNFSMVSKVQGLCLLSTEPVTSQELLLLLGLCKDLNSTLCMSSTIWQQLDKIWNHREKLFCIQRPGFPGAVLFPQHLSVVRISKGGHHPALLSSCIQSLTLWILISWKPGCQLLVWDIKKKYWGLD